MTISIDDVISITHTSVEFLQRWDTCRKEYARVHAVVNGADLLAEVLADVEHIFIAEANSLMTLDAAALRSGYSKSTLLASFAKEPFGPVVILPWHPYRRKWATERKHLPLKDVAAAGGWKDVNTLLRCYRMPDADTILAVMSEPKKVREIASVSS